MKKILILGANGLLGQSMVKRFAAETEYEIVVSSLEDKFYLNEKIQIPYYQVDLIERYAASDLINEVKPHIIVNAASISDVDVCEVEREQTWKVNVRAVENILEASKKFSPLYIHISTDYVFDGTNAPYSEMDEVNPLNYYGRSKMSAENIIKKSKFEYIIARTQVLYGAGVNVRQNFVTWVISSLLDNKKIKVVREQKGNPTYVDDLSEGIFRLITNKEYGLYHVSGSESINRYDFACKIAEVFGLDQSLIEAINIDELKQTAKRPKDSSFSHDKFINRTRWQLNNVSDGLKLLKAELESNG